MGFWNHLIMNHLMLANHASWARWLRLHSPEQWSEQQTCCIIHTDVCGPMSVETHGRYHCFLTFTDDLSRYGYIYLMKHKSEILEKFKDFHSEVENHRNKKIKFLRSDRRGKKLGLWVWPSIKTMWNSFTNSCHLEHRSIMVCLNVVTVLYYIWCNLWCLLPIYHCRFGVMI